MLVSMGILKQSIPWLELVARHQRHGHSIKELMLKSQNKQIVKISDASTGSGIEVTPFSVIDRDHQIQGDCAQDG